MVPTYNERDNIAPLVDGVKAAAVQDLDLLFVDDNSPDGTGSVVKELSEKERWVHLLQRPGKMGIGSAYQDGFRKALESLDPDVLVEMDADLQHPPAVIRELIVGIESGADVAVASRYIEGGGTEGWGLGRRLVSKGANWFARFFLGLSVRDCTSGFRAYNASTARKVVETRLPAKGFEFQVAVLHQLRRETKLEVPYTFRARKVGKSKLGLVDMVRFLFSVLRMSLG